MIGRQLPFMALILPFYVMALYGGMRSVRALWPVLLVAGGSFAHPQFIASNFLDYALTDVLASLGSLIVTLLFLQVWRPAPDPEFAIAARRRLQAPAAYAGARLAGLDALADRVRRRDRLDVVQGVRDRPDEHPLARTAQRDLDHALQRQALCGGLGIPAAGTGTAILRGGDRHRAVCQAVAGSVLRLRRARPSARSGLPSSP